MSKHRSLPSYVKDAPFGNGAPFIFLLIGLALSLLASPSPVAAYIPTGYQEYYVNGYEEHLWRMYMAINDNHTDPALTPGNICSTVSLVATANYQVIYYDHWEDGYESDLFNPVQATTEVYGDGVTGNGGTGTDILVAGDDINLVSVNSGATKHSYVPVNPNRNPAQIRYDGGDRVISTGGPVALAHAVWPYNASWVGDAFEIYSRQAQEGAYSYRLPIGQDLYTFGGGDTGSYGDFRDVYLQLQAFEDNTTVLIDNGAQAVNMTLNRGQTYSSMGYIDSSPYASLTINSGTRVHANKATQAVLITGADGTYQGRSFTVLSDRLWGSDYVVPVPSGAGTASPAEVYLSNPNDFPITVNGYDRFASTTFVISPTGYVSATVPYSRKRPGNAYVPGDSAARFTSADGVFGVFVAAGTSDSNYDWGASGMPSRYLTHDYYVSWAPGSDAVPPANNGSPVWVTPLENDTVFFVDYNTASGLDGVVDETFVLDVLEQRRVFDPDNDNTGMHIWASSEFAVFWGEDPRTAGVYNPYLDIGLTVLPARREWLAPMLALDKTVAPTSLPISGGAVTFTLVAQAINAFMSNVDVTDTLPANWSYVAGSALIQYPDGSSASQTPAISGQTLAWNLSYDLDINQSLTITFQAQTSAAGSYDDTAYDGFENNSYSGGSGWVGNWTEVGEIDGVGAGFVRVVGTEIGGTPAYTPCQGSYQLRIWDDSRRIYRVVNLSSFSAPILRFMRRYIVSSNDENFFLEISPDNSTWTQVRNWVNNSGNENTWVEEIIDLTPYRSATTYIRFSSRQAATMEDTDRLYIDQVKVYEGGLLNVNRGEASGIEPYSGALFNPTDEAVVYISPLKLTKAVNRSQAEIGHTLVYTLSYQNTSATSDATNVVLRDSVPVRYVTFLSATGGGTFDAASGTITWSLGTLAPLSSDSVSFQVQVNSFGKDGQVIKNVGRIESDEAVETRSNEVLTFLVEAPEIELVKDGPTVAYSGERITYTLSYENTGGARATNVVISDTLPVSVTYVGGSLEINTGSGWVARGSLSGPTLVIQPGVVSGTVEAGETGVIRFCVDLDSSLMAGELIMNWAVYDRDLDRPRDTNLVVTRISDLLLSKSAQQTAVAPGDVITYTLTYRNTGTVAHDNIVLREPIPDYTRFVGANTPAGLTLQYSVDNGLTWSTGTPPANTTHIRWLDASLAAGGRETVSFWVRVNSTLLPDTTIRNIASITSTRVMATVREPIPSNQVEVPTVDLWVSKHVAQSSATAGTAISYTISYGNRGSAGASSVQILDTLPAGTSYVAGSIWGTGANASGAPNLVWAVGAAAGQGEQQVGYAARLSPGLAPSSQVTNTASVSSTYEVETSLPVTTTITTVADLSVTKSDAIDPVLAGKTLTYTISYANAGPSDARDVSIVDTLPVSTSFDHVVSTNPSIPDPTELDSTLTWSPGTVAAGASGTIVFSVLVDGLAPASLTNSVTITSSTSEYAPGDESDSETTAVTRTVSFESMTYSVNEGVGVAFITVTLNSASPTPVSVRYATSNGTAIAGADYTTATDTLTFPPNTQTVAFTVTILNDTLDEPSETVGLSLSGPVGVALASPTFATLTIMGEDAEPTLSFSAASYSVGEADGTATVTVTLNAVSGRTVTVDYATSDGTAIAGADYTTSTGTLTFTPGVTSQSFGVTILGDTRDEDDETLNLSLSGEINATLGTPNTAVLTIADDEVNRPPVISDAVRSVAENAPNGISVGQPVTGTDPDGDELTYYIISGNVGSVFAIDINLGQITVFDNRTLDYETTLQYVLTVRASDGILSDTALVTITVTDVNEPPVADDDTFIVLEDSYDNVLGVLDGDTDPDSDPLTVYVVGTPDQGGVVVDNDSNVLYTPAADFVGLEVFSYTVSDGRGGLDSATVTVTVSSVNNPPILNPIGNQFIAEGNTLAFTATASDPDLPAQALSFSLDTGSVGSIDAGTGLFTWTPTEAQGPGAYTATVRVSDGALEDWETITISVSELNAAPQLDPIGDRVVDEGSLLAFTATASDPDLPAQALSFSLDAGSVGSIDAGTGLFTWTPTEAQGPGVYTATVRVSDGALEDWETITITVSEQQTLARVYFPLIMRNYYPLVGPDLVVERIVVVGSMAQVVIKNEGSALVNDGFWVDLYVDPDPVPTGVNQTWNDGRSAQGIVWAVAGPAAMQALEPGGVLTLTVGDAYYWPPDSRWGSLPPGTPVYAQVDSANALTTFGAVLEPHERAGGAYNNILGPVYSTQASVWATYGFAGRQAYHALTRPFPEGIPPRP